MSYQGKNRAGSISVVQSFAGALRSPVARRANSIASVTALHQRSLRVVVLGVGGVGKTGEHFFIVRQETQFICWSHRKSQTIAFSSLVPLMYRQKLKSFELTALFCTTAMSLIILYRCILLNILTHVLIGVFYARSNLSGRNNVIYLLLYCLKNERSMIYLIFLCDSR